MASGWRRDCIIGQASPSDKPSRRNASGLRGGRAPSGRLRFLEQQVRDQILLSPAQAEGLLTHQEEQLPVSQAFCGGGATVALMEECFDLRTSGVQTAAPGTQRPGVFLAGDAPVVAHAQIPLEVEQQIGRGIVPPAKQVRAIQSAGSAALNS